MTRRCWIFSVSWASILVATARPMESSRHLSERDAFSGDVLVRNLLAINTEPFDILWYIAIFVRDSWLAVFFVGEVTEPHLLHLWAWGVFPKPVGLPVPLQTIKRMDLRRRVPRKKRTLCHVCLALMGMALLQLGSCLVGANLSQSSSSSRIPAHQMSKVLQTVPTAPSFSFPPEPTVGKIEYKLRLTAEEGSERFEELVTQLNWRMRECTSEEECAEFDDLSQYRDAIYRLGVSDDGQVPGLSDAELVESLSVLKAMAARIPATVTIISRKAGIHPGNRSAITALVRASQSSLFVLGGGDEIRICTVGNVDSGKSTLLGLLTQGLQDDGRGRARSAVFRHRHEMETGRTSCIATTTLGFDQTGQVVNYKARLDKPWQTNIFIIIMICFL